MDLGAVKVWVEKQNYVLSLIWGTFSRQNGCVTRNVFLHYSWLLLACMIKRPHQRKYRGLLKSFFLLVAFSWSRAVALELILIFIYEARKLTLPITSLGGYKKGSCDKIEEWRVAQSEDISFFLYFVLPFSSFLSSPLISGAGNRSHRSSDVTQLSNSQLKSVQFTSSTTWCKWPSLWHAHRRQTPCWRSTRSQLCTLPCHIDMARYVNTSEELTHTHIPFRPLRPRVVTRCQDSAVWPVALGSFGDGPGKIVTNFLCVHVCVSLFSNSERQWLEDHYWYNPWQPRNNTRSLYSKNAGLMIAGCTVEERVGIAG